MPLSSMTGFGQAEASTLSGDYRIEIRSVNNRFLDIQVHLSRSFVTIEHKLKKYIASKIARGSIFVSINRLNNAEEGILDWDKNLVNNYITIFNKIRSQYKIKDEINLANLLTFSEIIKRDTTNVDDESLYSQLKPVLDKALKDLIASRQSEASYIVTDLQKMIKVLNRTITSIEKRAPVRLKKYIVDIKRKIKQITDKNIEPSRLAIEIAIMADRLDIAEECTRFRSHIDKLRNDLSSNGPVGKRLGFILQELNREANTIASKANDTKISFWSVVLKENIEKIREQILNIE